jgi:hypothetical protein
MRIGQHRQTGEPAFGGFGLENGVGGQSDPHRSAQARIAWSKKLDTSRKRRCRAANIVAGMAATAEGL